MSFSTLGLGPKLLQSVREAGYLQPTPIQLAAVPRILERHDLIGIAQTGTGKTAAFVLPILELMSRESLQRSRPRALIVAPTRELAAQIDETVRGLSRHLRLRCVTIFGGVGEQPQIDALRRGADIVVATPGRLLDLMGSGKVSLKDVQYLVLDEADRMLDMGFLPQIRRIVAATPKERQTLLFSATLSGDIERIAGEMLRQPKTVEIGRRSNPADTVTQALYPVPKSRKIDLLLSLLRDTSLDSVLIFSRTKHGADKIARKLKGAGIDAAVLHSNRSQGQRIQALNAFKSGKARVLVATDIAARGIDVEAISHVINFDFPMHAEDYVHRIGRTGRAQAEGDALSFVTPDDETYVRDVEKLTRKKIERRVVAGFDYKDVAPVVASRNSDHPSPALRAQRYPLPQAGEGGRRAQRDVRVRGGHSASTPRPTHSAASPASHVRAAGPTQRTEASTTRLRSRRRP